MSKSNHKKTQQKCVQDSKQSQPMTIELFMSDVSSDPSSKVCTERSLSRAQYKRDVIRKTQDDLTQQESWCLLMESLSGVIQELETDQHSKSQESQSSKVVFLDNFCPIPLSDECMKLFDGCSKMESVSFFIDLSKQRN